MTTPPSATRTATDTTPSADLGRLLLRIALGGVLFAHGLQKFTMMGVGEVGQYFGSLGIPMPEVAAVAVSVLELLGGVALVLGVLVRPVAVLAAIQLVVASLVVHAGAGFYAADGGWELTALLALSLIALALLGPGRLSVLGSARHRIPVLLR